MSSGFLEPPGPLTGVNDTVFWAFTVGTILMVLVAVVMVIVETRRLRSALPVVAFASAMLWLPNEPFVDAILGFQYAADSPVILFNLWGRDIPLPAIGVGAMFFIFPWAIYRMVLSGVTTRRIVEICLVAGVIDWLMEWPAIHWNMFEYYGENPSRILGLPLTSMVQNVFLYAFMAAVILFAAPYLKGWRSLLFLPVIPGCYLGAATLCTWPAYLALHGGWPTGVFLPLAVIAAAANAYVPLMALRIATDFHHLRAARDAAPADDRELQTA
jgi:hypothetical protein